MRQTRWYVITGAPCSGKTAVIRELERRGYSVVDEVARRLIRNRLAKGIPLNHIKAEPEAFETEIVFEKNRIEESLSADATIFLDRGVPDSIAYYQMAGLDPAPVVESCRRFRYAGVFYLQRLKLENDDVRTENEHMAADIGERILASYRLLGYEPMVIPVHPVPERTDRILETVIQGGAPK